MWWLVAKHKLLRRAWRTENHFFRNIWVLRIFMFRSEARICLIKITTLTIFKCPITVCMITDYERSKKLINTEIYAIRWAAIISEQFFFDRNAINYITDMDNYVRQNRVNVRVIELIIFHLFVEIRVRVWLGLGYS